MHRRPAIAAALAAAGLAAGATAATSAVAAVRGAGNIRWDGERVTQIGALRLEAAPTIAQATQAFGPSSSYRRQATIICVHEWTALGLVADFVFLGLAPAGRTVCSPDVGLLQTATISGTELRTWRGLGVGDSARRVLRLHPRARLRRGSFWLAWRLSVVGEAGRPEPYVRAVMRRGRVASFVLFVGAAGD